MNKLAVARLLQKQFHTPVRIFSFVVLGLMITTVER
jgi:hypothetical protein